MQGVLFLVCAIPGIGDAVGAIKTRSRIAACFTAGTQIKTAEGDKNIEDVEEGDYVFAEDPETGEQEYKKVIRTYIHEKTILVHVFVGAEEIETTPEHPFYVEGTGFVCAGELEIGDIIRTADGRKLPVDDIEAEYLEEPVLVYNYEVENYHTYYVSGLGVLVHNTCIVESGSSSVTVGDDNQLYIELIRSDENPVKGLIAKKSNKGMTIERHIISGSRNKGSQFISTTTDINIANKYANRDGCRIVEIDLSKLPSNVNIYDLSTVSGRNTYLKGITAKNFAPKSSEVLLEGYIPSEAVSLH